MAATAGVPAWFEPVSVPKAERAAAALHLLQYISPNAAELIALSEAICLKDDSQPSRSTHTTDHRESNRQGTAGRREVMELKHHVKRVLDAGVGNIVLTLGAEGAALCTLRYAIPHDTLQAFFSTTHALNQHDHLQSSIGRTLMQPAVRVVYVAATYVWRTCRQRQLSW
jgi:sugar/nucleoside kinase (ribokinase family)